MYSTSEKMDGEKQIQKNSIADYTYAMAHAFKFKAAEFLNAEKNVVPVIIEVPRRCPNKYEIDKETGLINLDRVLHSSIYYPGDYGYVPNTLCGDGDPIDVVVLTTYPLIPGALVFCRVIGVMKMVDQKGDDSKLIGVVENDPRNKGVEDITDVSPHILQMIEHFFATYKDLEGKEAWSKVEPCLGRETALKELGESIIMYNESVAGEVPDPRAGTLKPPDFWHASIQPSKSSWLPDGTPATGFPERVSVYIEVPATTNNKYEFDHVSGMLQLDRVLHSAVFYPLDYGFIPQTLCEDEDPLDILVLGSNALPVGSMVDVRVLGMMDMEDEKGGDCKVLGVIHNDPMYAHITEFEQVQPHIIAEIQQFFETYKALEGGKWVRINGWSNKEAACQEVRRTHQKYNDEAKKPLENIPRLDDLHIGEAYPSTINTIVKISKGDSNKYKIDMETSLIRFDRQLHSSGYYPFNYGVIPQTISVEHSMLDVVIVAPFVLDRRTVVECRVIGLLELSSETGPDHKIVAVPTAEPRMSEIQEIGDLASHVRDEIANFYNTWKSLEDKTKWTTFKSWQSVAAAHIAIRAAHDRFFLYGKTIENLESEIEAERKAKVEMMWRLDALEQALTKLEAGKKDPEESN